MGKAERRMKIAILGAGAIGSMLGMFLQKGGADLVLVDPYREHMEHIAQVGLEYTSVSGEKETVKMKTVTDPKQTGPADLVIVLTKGMFTEDALAGASNLIGESTYLMSLQNGLGQWEVLTKFVPLERVLQGCLGFSSALQGPGVIHGNINRLPGKVHVYAGCRVNTPEARAAAMAVVEYARAGSLTAEFAENIDVPVWKKAVNNVSCNALCGILHLTIGQMYADENGRRIHHGLLEELVAVARAKGLDFDAGELIASFEKVTLPGVEQHYSSTANDMFAHKKTEIEYLNGAISRYGRELGIPTPWNDAVTAMVRAIEGNYALLYAG